MTPQKDFLTHQQVNDAAVALARILNAGGYGSGTTLYPIPRGGVPAAYLLQAAAFNLFGNVYTLVDTPAEAHVIVDDLLDSGRTIAPYLETYTTAAVGVLFEKGEAGSDNGFSNPRVYTGDSLLPDKWVVFPWEATVESSAEDIGVRLLQLIGEDPNREGLRDTPARFVKAWTEWTEGYGMDPATLFKDFGDGAEGYDEMVIIDPIPFYSHCEHHLAAIFGTVHIAYIPAGRIAGLSKFARLVQMYSRRLQVQERLTTQLVDTIVKYLAPTGVAVAVRARHFCMESRGARTPGTETTTIAVRGAMKEDPAARAEFLSLIRGR